MIAQALDFVDSKRVRRYLAYSLKDWGIANVPRETNDLAGHLAGM
jgi:hypothetical protein